MCARLSVRWVDLLDLKMIGAPPVVCSKILSSIGNDIDDPKVVELPQVSLCRPGVKGTSYRMVSTQLILPASLL